MKKYLVLMIVLVQSCGWMETKTETVDLIGNVKILTSFDGNSGLREIVLVKNLEQGRMLKHLFTDCKSILLDSANYLIYIKSVSYDTDKLKYNLIEFKDKNNLNSFKTSEIKKDDFLFHIENCSECKLFEYDGNDKDSSESKSN